MTDKKKAVEALQWLLACLRAQYWNYQQSHWQTSGELFYENHLLFQRLYESVSEQVDTLAEKMVGLFGIETVDGLDLGAKFEQWIRHWSKVEDLHDRGLLSERGLQACCRDVYVKLKKLDEMTLGMDDFLMSLANEHETNQYLLRQVTRGKEG